MRALGRSITRRSGLSSLLMTGEMGRLDMISMVGPSFSGITLTERIITAGGDVRPACAPDWAAAGKEMRTPTTWQTRTSWGPMRDKTSFPRRRGHSERYHLAVSGEKEQTKCGSRITIRRGIRILQS